MLLLDPQTRAAEFQEGDTVSLLLEPSIFGRVVAVHAAIGAVDVAWPTLKVVSHPVEDLQRWDGDDPIPPSIPKTALYWAGKDRHYKATDGELERSQFTCPRCKGEVLSYTSYKRQEGKSVRLLGCRQCLFLIKPCDILGHPAYQDDRDPLKHLRVRRAGVVARKGADALLRVVDENGGPLFVQRTASGVDSLTVEQARQWYRQASLRLCEASEVFDDDEGEGV